MCSAKGHVRFTPESRHVQCNSACPLCAKSRHATMSVCAGTEGAVRCHVAGIGTKIICHDMSYYTDNFVDLPQDDRVIMLVS